MAANPAMLDMPQIRRERPRVESFAKLNKKEIVDRCIKFYKDDNENRTADIDARIQRYAKYRMWTEGKNWPWEGATDAAIADMMTASMRLQDTLHNAVMSSRPCVMAKATKKHDSEKTEIVDHLIDYQVFVEQPGEEIIGNLAHDFVNEGQFTAYVPWVKETRNVVDVMVLGEIHQEAQPLDIFRMFLEGEYPKAELIPTKEGWDWEIREGKKKHRASFFTRPDGELEVEIEREAIRFEGPRAIPKDYQDVGHPVRCENLQIPGPSNPMGASHVWLRDFPSVDEIKRLAKGDHPFYDLVKEEDLKKLGITTKDTSYQERAEQKDTMQGATEMKPGPEKGVESHNQLTRLMVFDCYDIDGDGVDEDVIWWVILETGTLLRARYLTQMFPSTPPRRPLAEGHLFPVPGRRQSIGLLEMMEGLHDLQKQFFDQGGDAGTLANAPFGFYRATSNMRPEVIRLWPGEMYPLNDPSRDVNFPQMGNQNQAFMFNMLGLLQQMEERLTTIGELQLGRVPHGKASALRTVSGMQTIMSQGDARPERVLRRFFIGLTQIWQLFHTLNQAFLPKNKQYMMAGHVDPAKDPYQSVSGPEKIRGSFMFDFSANALNTSKEALQMALQDLMGVYVSELALTLGIIKPDGIYRLLRDYGKAKGPDPDRYLSPPTPMAMYPAVFAEEAIAMLMDGQVPQGAPAEGAELHLQTLMEYTQSDEFGLFPPEAVPVFKGYLERVAMLMQQEQMMQQLMGAAQQFGQRTQQPGKSGPAAMPQGQGGMPMLQGGELADESLPGAGGGANTVPA